MTGATSDLLHNMSAPPQSAIIHHDRRSRCGGPGLIVRGELLPEPTTLRSILALFTGDEVPEADVERTAAAFEDALTRTNVARPVGESTVLKRQSLPPKGNR